MAEPAANAHRLRSALSLLKMQLQIGGYPREVLLRELEEAIQLLDEAVPPERQGSSDRPIRDGEQVGVVVVDDERQLAEVLARRLQREGLLARALHDLDSARSAGPSEVVILDLSLLDGAPPAARRWAAAVHPIVVTGASPREAERLLTGIEPFAVLPKPFSSEELASLVRRRAAEGRA